MAAGTYVRISDDALCFAQEGTGIPVNFMTQNYIAEIKNVDLE